MDDPEIEDYMGPLGIFYYSDADFYQRMVEGPPERWEEDSDDEDSDDDRDKFPERDTLTTPD